jgi:hypothetical protein
MPSKVNRPSKGALRFLQSKTARHLFVFFSKGTGIKSWVFTVILCHELKWQVLVLDVAFIFRLI